MTRANPLGPLDPIFDVETSYGGISVGNTPGINLLTVTINQAAGQPDPATVEPILFDIEFSEDVVGFDGSGVLLGGTAFIGESRFIGGTITLPGDDIMHTFTSGTSSLDGPSHGPVDVHWLAVGGGSKGGNAFGGGGGGGEVVYGTDSVAIPLTTVVGAAGTVGVGGTTTISTILPGGAGGGGLGGNNSVAGGAGVNGGGGGGNPTTPGAGGIGSEFNGGAGADATAGTGALGGGGAGADGPGIGATGTKAGDGGPGRQWLALSGGNDQFYGGGGGGGSHNATGGVAGDGGVGGGGDGVATSGGTNINGSPATANTGGGGGGSGHGSSTGGAGSAGVIKFQYDGSPAYTVEVTGSGSTYQAAVWGMNANGDATATIPAGVCTAVSSGTPNIASTSTDNTVTWINPDEVVVISTDEVTATAATEITTPLPVGWQVFDVMMVFLHNLGSTGSWSTTPPTGWTFINQAAVSTLRTAGFYRRLLPGDTTPTFDYSGTEDLLAHVMLLRNVNRTTILDQTTELIQSNSPEFDGPATAGTTIAGCIKILAIRTNRGPYNILDTNSFTLDEESTPQLQQAMLWHKMIDPAAGGFTVEMPHIFATGGGGGERQSGLIVTVRPK